MKKIIVLLVTVAALAGVVAITVPASLHADESGAPTFVTKFSRIPRLESDLSRPRRRQSPQLLCCFGQRCSDKGLPRREAPIPGRFNHSRSTLQSRPVGGKQQSLWRCPIFRSAPPDEHSVYGQGLTEVRCDGRLGVRYLHRRQTERRRVNENLLPLPQSNQGSRPGLHALRTLISENPRRSESLS